MAIDWQKTGEIGGRSYTCGYCGRGVGPNQGYWGQAQVAGRLEVVGWIYICTYCTQPTYFDPDGRQVPGSAFGNPVSALPAEINALYEEARTTTAAGAFTAAVLCCRKVLMHVAVEEGADPNQSFLSYVEYLANHGYVPPKGHGWVDHIRRRGNDANHEIVLMSQSDAQELVAFTEMLLKLAYEFPSRVPVEPDET